MGQEENYPIQGKWKTEYIFHKCIAIASTHTKFKKAYLSISEYEWKKRFYNHTKLFRNKRYINETCLSSYILKTKKVAGETPTLT